MDTSLYTLTNEFTRMMEIEDDEEMELALLEIGGAIEQKVENVCKVLKMIGGTAEQFKAEEERIKAARKALENRAERLKNYMKDSLLFADINKVSAGTFKVSISPSPGSVVIDDLAVVPPQFVIVIPEQYQPDKAQIKEAIKAGEAVPGVHIEAGYTLRIR